VGTWHDLDLGRPIAAPLEHCAELLGVDLATVRELAANVEPYIRSDGTRIWSLMQLERQLRPQAYGRRRGDYLDRRRNPLPKCSFGPPDGPTVLDDSAGSNASALMEALTPMVGIMESPRSTTRPRGRDG
jgi:hypothetical protein